MYRAQEEQKYSSGTGWLPVWKSVPCSRTSFLRRLPSLLHSRQNRGDCGSDRRSVKKNIQSDTGDRDSPHEPVWCRGKVRRKSAPDWCKSRFRKYYRLQESCKMQDLSNPPERSGHIWQRSLRPESLETHRWSSASGHLTSKKAPWNPEPTEADRNKEPLPWQSGLLWSVFESFSSDLRWNRRCRFYCGPGSHNRFSHRVNSKALSHSFRFLLMHLKNRQVPDMQGKSHSEALRRSVK